MKFILTLLTSLTLTLATGQINLVPNPSFEINDTCPKMPGEIYHALGWYSASSDISNYLNSCATYSNDCSVPKNIAGYQYAATGNGYAGVFSYSSLNVSASGYTEIIGGQLINPLVIGQKYYAKFKLNCAMGSNNNTAIDKMGIRFCNVQHNNTNNNTFFNNFAHVYSSFIVNDTTNWTNIFGSFIADSAYSFIEAGNFFDYQNVNKQIVRINGSSDQCFYFIDDICVSTDSLYTTNWTWTGTTGIKQTNYPKISFYPNPTSDQSTLQFDNTKAELCTLTLYDLRGQIMRTINNITSDQVVIQKNDLTTGLYYFVLRTSDRVVVTGKLAIE